MGWRRRRIAKDKGWNPNKWFGHVEKAMLLLEKPESLSEIQTRYASDVQLLPH